MSINQSHRADKIFEPFIKHEASNTQHDPRSISLPNSPDRFQIKIIEVIKRNSEGYHPAASTEFGKDIRALDIVRAAYNNCLRFAEDVTQYRCERHCQLFLADNVTVISEDQSSAMTAGQISQHGSGIRPMNVNDIRFCCA